MKSSARNQLTGTIHRIEDFSGCLSIAVQCGSHLVYSHISPLAYRSLKPQIGQTAVVLFKANAITLFTEIHPLRLSAENSLEARVEAIEQGAPKVIPGLLGAKTSNSKCFLEASEGT